jgi:SAM-dependent methyltransferase
MKIRESGMPLEAMWETFFRPHDALDRLSLAAATRDVVEFGCGYGTFTLAAARRIRGVVYALDIDPDMVARTQQRAAASGIANVSAEVRDFLQDGTGLPDNTADYVMVFNLLHAERPAELLAEAYRVLTPGGRAGVMHWNYDAQTPRGPSLDIRPRPEACMAWAIAAGFAIVPPHMRKLPPYHFGLVGQKPLSSIEGTAR